MGDPGIVKAIEESFIPLCIYNNSREGHEAKILKKFKEMTCNNPVVRIVSADDGKDLVKPIRTDWSRGALVEAMAQALESRKKEIPEALSALIGKAPSAEKK